MLTTQIIEKRIVDALPDSKVQVIDTTGGGDHFEATVVSASFAGKSIVQQHKLVYAAVRDMLDSGELHALALKTSAS